MENRVLIYAFLALLAFTGCSIDDDGLVTITNNVALGLVFNASPDTENLNFFADNNRINTRDLQFNRGQGYFRFFSGNRNLRLLNANGEELASQNLRMADGSYYSIFAVDSLSNVSLLTVNDRLTFPNNNHFHIRFIHLSPDAPEVNFEVGSNSLGSFEFKNSSEFLAFENGTYDLKITDNEGNMVLIEENVQLQSGYIYTYIALGLLGEDTDSENALQLRRIINFSR